ncbi:hypothetical protein [Streptomyces sennicomposti]
MTAPIAATTDTPPDVTQAEAEALAAEQAAEALAERVREGDDQVTAEQLATAQQAGVFARLRAEAARRKAEREATAAEEKRRAALVKQAAALADDQGNPAPIAAAYDRAAAAVAELVAAVEEHDQAVTEAGRLLREAGCGPLIEYVRVDHGDYATQEPRRAAASRTAPRVDPTAPAVSFGEDSRHAIGAGPLLAVLVDQVAAGEAGQMPHGSPHLTAAPLREHAGRHGEQVRAFLDRAAEVAK